MAKWKFSPQDMKEITDDQDRAAMAAAVARVSADVERWAAEALKAHAKPRAM